MRRRRNHRARHRENSLASVSGQAKAISMRRDSGLELRPSETLQSNPIIEAWPKGYQGFRLDGNAVIVFATGKPDMRIENAI
jgi:hypothetical protein